MKENPANTIKDSMWDFLKDGGQYVDNNDIELLKDSVYRLIDVTKQERSLYGSVDFQKLDMDYIRPVVMISMALVLSGILEGKENE